MKKGKKKYWVSVLIVLLVVVVGGLSYVYFPQNKGGGSGGGGSVVKNPVAGLSDEEAIAQFDESFVSYLLYSIGAGNLHNPPLSKDTPKILIVIEEINYNAEIVDGRVIVKKGKIENGDIIIVTSREEGVKMLRDRNYFKSSFVDGKSAISMIAGNTELFSKGYLEMYNGLVGE